ncbi:unnamed protein product [Urochloa humidicola]
MEINLGHASHCLQLHKFYQSRSSSRTVSVAVLGNKVLLYGGGPTLTAAGGKQAASSSSVAPVPMVLRTTLHSRAYVLGALKFTLAVECRVVMNRNKLTTTPCLARGAGRATPGGCGLPVRHGLPGGWAPPSSEHEGAAT